MSVSNLDEAQLEQLARCKKELVERGEKIAKTAAALALGNKKERAQDGEEGSRKDSWTHQVRRLLNAASEETEPLVMLNLLRYQSVRNQGPWGKDPSQLVKPVEEALEWCRGKAPSDEALAMVLIQHLLCYAYRQYTFETEQAEPAEAK